MTESPESEATPDKPPEDYVADISFDDLGLSPEVRKAVAERGYVNPTPVQARAWKPVMAGRDLIVRSKTGTGKTAAFGLPVIERIPMGTREVKALCLCPTRELALQVSQELESLAKYRDIRVTAIYGGASMKQQEDALTAGSAIIVGTPGRVHDHIRRGNLKLGNCTHAVLDEADEMLNQGFYEEVTRILDCLPQGRQVLLFSATVPEDIQRLISKYTTNAETLLLSGDVYTVDHINHVRYEISDAFPKPRNLLYLLEMEEPDNAIIFCNRRDDTELVTAVLNRNGFDAELLNGDLPQKERERVMGKIKRGEVAYMVATDLAARGIDISDLGHVINYSLPEDPAVYLHRVGRTGRMSKKGTALNLTSGRELATLTVLERKYGIVFERKNMPTPEEAAQLWSERHVHELKDAAQGAIYEGFLGLASELKTRPDADELIAFMLRYFFTHRRMEKVQPGDAEAAPATSEPSSGGSGRGRGERERPRREERGGRGERGPRRDRVPRSERPTLREETPGPGPGPAADPQAVPTAPSYSAPASHDDEIPAVAQPKTDRALFDTMKPIPATTARSSSEGERPPRRDRGERGERGERGDRGDRHGRGRDRSEREHRDVHDSGAARPAGPKLSDRELFEALQSGKPLPPIDDPTARPPPRPSAAPQPTPSGTEAPAAVRAERQPGEPREDRGRRERRPRERGAPPAELEAGMARVWVNLGRLDNLDEAGVAAALESAGAPAGKVSKTELRGTYSYVHVAEADVAAFEGTSGKMAGEKALKVERARR